MNHDPVSEPTPTAKPDSAPPSVAVQSYAFGPFRIDVAARHLLRHDTVIPLTAKVFDTLLFLVKNHERPVTKDELMHAVWPDSFVSDDSLVQNISAVRRALGDDPSQPRYIATLARRGYRFVASVQESTDRNAEAPPEEVVQGNGEYASSQVAGTRPAANLPPLWVTAALVAAAVVITALVMASRFDTNAASTTNLPIRFRETVPPDHDLVGGGVLSPDSRYLAFVARDAAGATRLWLRVLESGTAEPLPGTERASRPFWSPDSRFLGFFANNQVKRVAVAGGLPRPLAPTQRGDALGGTWGAGDRILYADQGRILSVDTAGSEPAVVAEPDRASGQGELRWPQFLPDGEHFLFFASHENPERAGIYVGQLGSRETMFLLAGTSRAVFAPPGNVLFVRDRALLAQRFDPNRRQLGGDPMVIAGDVSENAVISATSAGLLAFSDAESKGRLQWFDRSGKPLGTVAVPRVLSNMTLSPDGRQLLGASSHSGNWVMWLVDLERNVSTQVAVNAAFPVWSPDGSRFAFTSVTGGGSDIFVRSVTTAAQEEALLRTDAVKSVDDWSPDGRHIVYYDHKNRNLWLLPTSGDRKPVPFLEAPTRRGRISPDGGSIAYVSDELGTNEVYLQSFPVPGIKRRVSTNGGSNPVWRRDGRELFYIAGDQLMAVPMRGDEVPEPDAPRPLFALPDLPQTFVASVDGQRFLVSLQNKASERGTITVLTNWQAALTP